MDEAWGPFKKQFSFGSRGAFDRNVLSFFFSAVRHCFLEVSMHPEGPANGQIDRCIACFFLGPRPHAELINKIYIALRASHAAPPPRPKETKIFFKSQPSIDDQYFVVISSSKTQNSFQMFGCFAVQHNPTGHFPSSYLVFPTFYLATSPPLPQGRADCLENFRAVNFLTSPMMMI